APGRPGPRGRASRASRAPGPGRRRLGQARHRPAPGPRGPGPAHPGAARTRTRARARARVGSRRGPGGGRRDRVGRGRPDAGPPPAPEAAPEPAATQAVRAPAVPPGQAPPALAPDRRTATVPIDIQRLRALIRDVPDFPKPGIVFKDITPLLADEVGFSLVIDETGVHFGRGNVDKVVGIEARGFILASPVAYHFGAGFVPVRKAGKLPYQVEAEE